MEISQPPPSAKPLIAAITGMGKVSSLRNTSLPFLPKASPSALVSVLISPMSAPATKDFCPAPVKIRHLTSSRLTLSRVWSSSSSTVEFNAFSAFSRLMVMMPVAPFCSYTINSIYSLLLLIMYLLTDQHGKAGKPKVPRSRLTGHQTCNTAHLRGILFSAPPGVPAKPAGFRG